MKPSVGRIVHFSDAYGMCRAAIITGVREDNIIDLTFFSPGVTGALARTKIKFDENKSESSWHWPERVE